MKETTCSKIIKTNQRHALNNIVYGLQPPFESNSKKEKSYYHIDEIVLLPEKEYQYYGLPITDICHREHRNGFSIIATEQREIETEIIIKGTIFRAPEKKKTKDTEYTSYLATSIDFSSQQIYIFDERLYNPFKQFAKKVEKEQGSEWELIKCWEGCTEKIVQEVIEG